MKYNTEQQEAILHQDGPALILAGPGSGKTAVITGRIHALIHQYHISPSKILVISYTRAASRESEERFRRQNGGEAAVTFGTIHAICYKILRVSRPGAAYSVISEKGRRRLLAEALTELEIDPEEVDVEMLEADILNRKSDFNESPKTEGSALPPEQFFDLFRLYERKRKAEGYLDFEDLLRECLDLFDNRALLTWWQDRFPYILVDEFQDVNDLQYHFIRALAGKRANLFVVGDEDQTIYGFRGARQQILLDFPSAYPAARVIRLKACYRCSPQILKAAVNLIGHNQKRFEKTLFSQAKPGPLPSLLAFGEKSEELGALAAAIGRQLRAGMKAENMAVLCRTRFGLGQAAAALWKERIPFSADVAQDSDYRSQTAEDLFAYLRLAAGGRKRKDYLQIMNKPQRFLPRRLFPEEEMDRERLWTEAKDHPAWQNALLRLFLELDQLKELRPYAAIEYIRKEMGYEKYLTEYEKERGQSPARQLELLDRLQEESALYATAAEWESARFERMSENASPGQVPKDGVRLLTMHGAKGLEFDAVFLPGLNEGVLPGPKILTEEAMEAERRLLYVAMTRARQILWMSYITKHRGARLYPSRFLKETGLAAENGSGNKKSSGRSRC